MLVFEGILILLAGAIVLTACARRLKLPYPSLPALGGIALAALPNHPEFRLEHRIEERLDDAEVNAG
jgi:CPA1 family monovalent cation:H+ antiporter